VGSSERLYTWLHTWQVYICKQVTNSKGGSMKTEWHIDNRGTQWRQITQVIGEASNELHVGYDTLYAYLFQAALAFVQKRIVAGCNAVIIIAQFGDYDNAEGTLQAGRLVMGWMVVYTDINTGLSPVVTCLYSRSGKDANTATDIYTGLVAMVEAELEV
jgi:hypothetical protein